MNEFGYWPDYGYLLCGDVENSAEWLLDMHCKPTLILADPPYGDILPFTDWDTAAVYDWIQTIKSFEQFQCPIYWWGGIGKPDNRPFFQFILEVESKTEYRMRDMITWKKKRAFGKKKDYLFIREECALLTYRGEEPSIFNIPLLDTKRGYAGYNAKYPAKSEYLRRGNVWDESELFKNKVHPAQKAGIVNKIPILAHTNENDLVLDLYSGSGEASIQAIRLERKFIAIERNKETCLKIMKRIEDEIAGFDQTTNACQTTT